MMDYVLITFLIILGAAALVVIGFAVARLFVKDVKEEDSGMKGPSNEQIEYMASVRNRYFNYLVWTAREARMANPYTQRPSFAA
ncbi:hypothetical protein FKW77_003347 [Venturia effusa]|uniref:Uncharacterized protein n=1 Tax=Venturia effusa TaxID=50376 RepID=A0A517L711_9PEZI|nr:hypothetical protein FKW77_003347 [Venturia effusa]